MPRFTYESAIEALYDAAVDTSRWSHALETVSRYVGGTGAILVSNDLKQDGSWIVSGGLRDDLARIYVRDHAQCSMNHAIARHAGVGVPLLVSSLPEARDIRRSAVYSDIWRPQKLVDVIPLATGALTRPGMTGGVAVMLQERHADDAAKARRRMARIAPHVARAVELALELGKLQTASEDFSTLLGLLPSAALLLDGSGRIVMTNRGADAILASNDGVAGAAGQTLQATFPGENRRLRSALAVALSVGDDPDRGPEGGAFQEGVTIQRPSGLPPLLVVFTPLQSAFLGQWTTDPSQTRLLVQVIDPVATLLTQARLLERAYGLTPSEARVASLVSSGMTTPLVARALGLAPTTVRTHLSHVFEKTGTRSQVVLSRLIGAVLA